MTQNSDAESKNRPQITSPPLTQRDLSTEDETIEKVLSPEETLVKKPSTFDLKVPPDLKRETRYGDALMGQVAQITFLIRGYTSKRLDVEISDNFIIGRTANKGQTRPDLDLNRYGGYISGVSREHVRITKDANILTVTDLGSRNGSFLNGMKLNPNQPRILRDGDELCLGTLFLRILFRSSVLDAKEPPANPDPPSQ